MEARKLAAMTLLPWKRATGTESPAHQSFEELAMPLLGSLYNVARWLTHNASDAEDLVQETFLKGLRGFSGFQQGSNFKAWIFRILRNTYLSSRQGLAARRTVALEPEWNDTEAIQLPEGAIDRETPELNLMRLADRAALEDAMQELAPPLLEVLLLCDVEEMKYREIASVLEIPIGTVMSRVARARAALRTSLQGHRTTAARARL